MLLSDDQRFADGLFGQVDGAVGELREHLPGLATFDSSTGVGRPVSDSKIRVVVGKLGSGKSLYLRRMQDHQLRNNESVFSIEVSRNGADFQSEDLANFARMMDIRGSNTEIWKLLWRRAIVRSTASYLFASQSSLRPRPSARLFDEVGDYQDLLEIGPRAERITAAFAVLLRRFEKRTEAEAYLKDRRWSFVEGMIVDALRFTRPIFLYIDAIDDNFKYGPTLWMQCQRGLYYTIMDLLRDRADIGGRLHVVAALRDIVLSSTSSSEHGPRYNDNHYTNTLHWNRRLVRDFLVQKLATLPDELFTSHQDHRLSSLLGFTQILPNDRPHAEPEYVEEYLLRHTRLVPRDIVTMGNRLCEHLAINGPGSIDPSTLRRIVSEHGRIFCRSQLAQCANQMRADALPQQALEEEWAHVAYSPNDFQVMDNTDSLTEIIQLTEREIFSLDDLLSMDELARQRFNGPVSAADALWVNQLIGIRTSAGTCRFYSLGDMAENRIPRSGAMEYVWNPITFDAIPALKPILPNPCWPER